MKLHNCKRDWSFTMKVKVRAEDVLLDRLRCDCEYYLGYGVSCAKQLWAHDEQKQIDKMRELYDLVPEKPEWLIREQIDAYAAQMGAE